MMKSVSFVAVFALWMTTAVGQTTLQTVTRAVPTQTIWFPLEEADMLDNIFEIIGQGYTVKSPMTTMISVAISTDNTVIWVSNFSPV
jgi:hypothetical protein